MARKRFSPNGPCLCGSGKKFKHCCRKKGLEYYEEGDGNVSKSIPISPEIEKYKSRQSRKKPRYPIGTVAMYGPDDKITTKFAAAVIMRENAEPIINRWMASDITTNPKIQREIGEFFKSHGVKQVVMSDGNMGCPHEEGPDFPLGEDCPFCPFWKGKQGSNSKE